MIPCLIFTIGEGDFSLNLNFERITMGVLLILNECHRLKLQDSICILKIFNQTKHLMFGAYQVTESEIKEFAGKYDPQFFI